MAQNWGGYTAYTPTITGSTTSPTLGTASTSSGRYRQHGTRVWGRARIQFGTAGTAAGSGSYGFLLPVEPADEDAAIGMAQLIHVDNGTVIPVRLGVLSLVGSYFAASTSKAVIVVDNYDGLGGLATGANPVGAEAPWAWGAYDAINFQFDFEAATG